MERIVCESISRLVIGRGMEHHVNNPFMPTMTNNEDVVVTKPDVSDD
jgi:hypothetical protein